MFRRYMSFKTIDEWTKRRIKIFFRRWGVVVAKTIPMEVFTHFDLRILKRDLIVLRNGRYTITKDSVRFFVQYHQDEIFDWLATEKGQAILNKGIVFNYDFKTKHRYHWRKKDENKMDNNLPEEHK